MKTAIVLAVLLIPSAAWARIIQIDNKVVEEFRACIRNTYTEISAQHSQAEAQGLVMSTCYPGFALYMTGLGFSDDVARDSFQALVKHELGPSAFPVPH